MSRDTVGIPELEVDELIELANEIVEAGGGRGDGDDSDGGGRNGVRFRIDNLRDARAVIIEHEGNNNYNNNYNSDNEDFHRDAAMGSIEHVRRPLWFEVIGLIIVTLFLLGVYWLVLSLVLISSFSRDFFKDIFDFVDTVNKGNYSFIDPHSLINKFAIIIKTEIPNLPDTLWMVITLVVFATYIVMTTIILILSMMFSLMCLSMCCVSRWRYLGEFFMRLVES